MSSATFARHETFHPRFGWIKKGFDAANDDPSAFIRGDAHVRLGVGKNMVRAIRYWCHAFKVLQDDPDAPGRQRRSIPTEFGRFLLGEHGIDPYLEDLGSLWLLHWHLLKDPSAATAWQFAFFVSGKPEFSAAELVGQLGDYVAVEFPTARAARSSLKKDATCILRMYGEMPTGKEVSEESIQCPFAELGLLRPVADGKRYAFRLGPKPGLSDVLATAVCLDYAATRQSGARTIALSRLLRDEGSPGLAFRLTEADLYAALERQAQHEPSIAITEAAGVIQLSYSEPAARLSEQLILSHYGVGDAQEAA